MITFLTTKPYCNATFSSRDIRSLVYIAGFLHIWSDSTTTVNIYITVRVLDDYKRTLRHFVHQHLCGIQLVIIKNISAGRWRQNIVGRSCVIQQGSHYQTFHTIFIISWNAFISKQALIFPENRKIVRNRRGANASRPQKFISRGRVKYRSIIAKVFKFVLNYTRD